MNIKAGPYQRVYKLHYGDVFCVDVKTFLSTSTLWSKDYQIIGTSTIKRKHWWCIWKSNRLFVKIQYLGGDVLDEKI